MRLLKLAIISFLVLFAVISVISALLPRNILVSRATDIHADVNSVKEQVINLPNWNNWMPLDESVSFAYSKKENALRSGNTKITAQEVSDSLLVTQWQTGTNKMKGSFRIIQQPNDIITVQWQMEERIGWWPWEKLTSLTADKVLGSSMEKSLERLKTTVEVSK